MPQYGIECTIGQKPGDMISSIIEPVISVMQIKSKQLGNVSQDKKHDGNQMPRNVGLAEWLHKGSTKAPLRDHHKIVNQSIISMYISQVGISMQFPEDL